MALIPDKQIAEQDAANVTYEPGVPANWPSPPTLTSVALDDLAVPQGNAIKAKTFATNAGGPTFPADGSTVPVTGWVAALNGGQFNVTTGVWTAPATDTYAFSAQITFNPAIAGAPGTTGYDVLLQKSTDGGTTWVTLVENHVVLQAATVAPAFPNVSVQCAALNASDEIRVAGAQSSGSVVPLAPMSTANYFTAARV